MKEIFLLFAFLISASFLFCENLVYTNFKAKDNSIYSVIVAEQENEEEIKSVGYKYYLSIVGADDEDIQSQYYCVYYYYNDKKAALKHYKSEIRKHINKILTFYEFLDILDNSDEFITDIDINPENNTVVYIYKKFCE